MAETHTDCRSEEGITVGLIDAMISIARVLARRDMAPDPVRQALRDLGSDEDLHIVWATANEIIEDFVCPEDAHVWQAHKNPDTPDGPGERYEICKVCGIENREEERNCR